jgi:hypothetical protein
VDNIFSLFFPLVSTPHFDSHSLSHEQHFDMLSVPLNHRHLCSAAIIQQTIRSSERPSSRPSSCKYYPSLPLRLPSLPLQLKKINREVSKGRRKDRKEKEFSFLYLSDFLLYLRG